MFISPCLRPPGAGEPYPLVGKQLKERAKVILEVLEARSGGNAVENNNASDEVNEGQHKAGINVVEEKTASEGKQGSVEAEQSESTFHFPVGTKKVFESLFGLLEKVLLGKNSKGDSGAENEVEGQGQPQEDEERSISGFTRLVYQLALNDQETIRLLASQYTCVQREGELFLYFYCKARRKWMEGIRCFRRKIGRIKPRRVHKCGRSETYYSSASWRNFRGTR